MIGVSMDGLGYGDDGVLWGGEVLVCDLLGYRRVAHLEELPLPGGAAAIATPVAHRARLELRAARATKGSSGRRGCCAAAPASRASAGPSDEDLDAVARADRRRRQRAAHDQLRPAVRRRGRARRRAPRDHLRGPGGDRARDALRGRRPSRIRSARRDVEAAAAAPRDGAGEWVAARAGGRGSARRLRRAPRAAVRRVLDDLEAGAAGRRRRRPPARHDGRRRPRRLPPGARRDRPGGRRPGRRRLPEPAARRPLRGGARRPTASTCSPPGWCPPTTAASRSGRPPWRAILCSNAAATLD